MRILLIHNYLSDRGGEDRCFDLLTKLLQDKGHDLYIYTKDSKKIINSNYVKIRTAAGMFRNKNLERELTTIIKKFNPDIAHISNIFPLIGQEVYMICKRFKVPIIQSIHSYRYLCPKATLFRNGKTCELCITKNFFYPSIIYRCYHNSRLASFFFASSYIYHNTKSLLALIDKFIFPAEFARNYFIENLKIPIKKTTVIPNFVYNIKSNNPSLQEKNYFLFVGRFSEEKGILNLLKIFSNLPDLNLIVVGDGPLKNEVLKYQSRNIAVKSSISRQHLDDYMKSALALIIPSAPLYDFGPLVLIEAYANSTPVIAPKSGVFLERIIERKTGVFYNPGNLDDLKNKILYVSTNKQRLIIMGKFAKKEYLNKYTPKKHYDMLLMLYNKSMRKFNL